MNFEWDERKRQTNIRKHGIDISDAPEIFNGPMLTQLDIREDYGEDRWISIGLMRGRIVVIVFTERDEGKTIRIISLRKALNYEQKQFERKLRNRLGAD
ncbi:MAG TPA: BrnT family toxin [Chloroflexi bacterium]|nr:BrnT family toxin [Chloroflexota bacterium]